MRLVLPVPPSWNASYRAGKGRFYTPDAILTFRKQVAVAGKNARIHKIPRHIMVRVDVWWYRARKSGDMDKRVSVLLDALQEVWYVNDAQVVEQHAYRMEDPINPRIEVEVHSLQEDAA